MRALLRHAPMVLFVVVAILGSANSSSATNLADQLEVNKDTLRRIDPDTGEQAWQIVHASTWRTLSQDTHEHDIIDPVVADGSIYYAVYNWLLRADPTEGVIEQRRLFPGVIKDIQIKDADGPETRLIVNCLVDPEKKDGQTVAFTHRPGSASPQEIWSPVGILLVWKDALNVSEAASVPYVSGTPEGEATLSFSKDKRRAAIETLKTRRPQEPSNPFYDYFIGAIQQKLGHQDKAQSAYKKAVHTDGAHWVSWLQLTAFLQGAGQLELADKAFDRARQRIQHQPGVRVREWTALPAYVLTLGWSRHKVQQAVAARDFHRVSRMLERVAWTFPNLPYTPKVWRALSQWFQDHGQQKLAAEWRTQRQRAERSPWRSFFQAYRTVDLTIALVVGFALAFWLACFVIGARRSESNYWLSRPTKLEWTGLLAAALLPIALLYVQDSAVQKILTIADRPPAVAWSSWTSPKAQTWAQDLHPSEARTELLTKIETLAHKTRMGQIAQTQAPDPQLIVDAIDADTRAEAWRHVFWGGKTKIMKQFDLPVLPITLAIWIGLGALLFALGGLAGRISLLETAARFAIPGGARSASLLTPILLGLGIAAVGALTIGLDSIIERIAQPGIGTYFGLETVFTDKRLAEPTWHWWVTLTAVLLTHAVTLWRDTSS